MMKGAVVEGQAHMRMERATEEEVLRVFAAGMWVWPERKGREAWTMETVLGQAVQSASVSDLLVL
jgi:hypothetical protein